jgi:hypothetical protein
VILLCNIKADLRDIPEEKFRKCSQESIGQEFYTADFTIELLVDNARLKFVLNFDGVQYGSAEPVFDI